MSPTPQKSKSVDKKTAIKLINSYAESYQIKDEENLRLKSQIKEMNSLLNEHKNLINRILSTSSKEEKERVFVEFASAQLEKEKEKNEKYESQIKEMLCTQVMNEKLCLERIEKIKEKVFLLENANVELSNTILILKQKLGMKKKEKKEKQMEDEENEVREVIISDPSLVVCELNSQIHEYKEMINNLIVKYKELYSKANENEMMIDDLKYENLKVSSELREKQKELMMRTYNIRNNLKTIETNKKSTKSNKRYRLFHSKEKEEKAEKAELKSSKIENFNNILSENINKRLDDMEYRLSEIQKDNTNIENRYTNNNENANDSSDLIFNKNLIREEMKLERIEESNRVISENNIYDKLDTSEWRDIIRIFEFDEDNYQNLFISKTKSAEILKYREIIDVIISYLIEKNRQIQVLNTENDKLNKENKSLFEKVHLMEKENFQRKNEVFVSKECIGCIENIGKVKNIHKESKEIKERECKYRHQYNFNSQDTPLQQRSKNPRSKFIGFYKNMPDMIINSSDSDEQSIKKEKTIKKHRNTIDHNTYTDDDDLKLRNDLYKSKINSVLTNNTSSQERIENNKKIKEKKTRNINKKPERNKLNLEISN